MAEYRRVLEWHRYQCTKNCGRKQKSSSETVPGMSRPYRLSKFKKVYELSSTSVSHEQIRENSFCRVSIDCCWCLLLLGCLHIYFYKVWGELFLWYPLLTLWIVFLGRGDHRSYKHNTSFQLLHPLQCRTHFIFQFSRINMNRKNTVYEQCKIYLLWQDATSERCILNLFVLTSVP